MSHDVTMSLQDMRTKDPKEFQRRYYEWASAGCDHYDWWESTEEFFREDMAPLGLTVDKIHFSLSYGQGDYASVDGTLDMHLWMQAAGYGESHLALCLDAKEYAGYWRVSASHRGMVSVADIRYEPGNTRPSGIFSDLPQDAWDALVLEQYESEDWDKLATEWVRERCEELYRLLRDEYEYLTSEEAFIEWSKDNEI